MALSDLVVDGLGGSLQDLCGFLSELHSLGIDNYMLTLPHGHVEANNGWRHAAWPTPTMATVIRAVTAFSVSRCIRSSQSNDPPT